MISLVGYSKRVKQEALEKAISQALVDLSISDARHKHTGDGYVCVLLGDASARMVDFVSVILLELGRHSPAPTIQAGLDFGFLDIRQNEMTGHPEHFDLPVVQATRLEQECEPGEILSTETFHYLFAPLSPESFTPAPREIRTKGRTSLAYKIKPLALGELQQTVRSLLMVSKEAPPLNWGAEPPGALIVEDEPGMARFIGAVLESGQSGVPMRPHYAEETATANVVFTENEISLIIIDNMLPGSWGIDWVVSLLTENKRIPIIMISSGSDQHTVDLFYKSGGCFFLAKPLRADCLGTFVRLSLSEGKGRLWEGLDRLPAPREVVVPRLIDCHSLLGNILRATQRGDVAMSLINHKARHAVADFVKAILPGNNVAYHAAGLETLLTYLLKLTRVAESAAKIPLLSFLRQYIEDQGKLHDMVRLEIVVEPVAEDIADRIKGGAILALIVCELIDNAVVAVERKGRVAVNVVILRSTNRLQVVVSDDGPGVPPELKDLIFNNGFSTKGLGRGFGLYLARKGARGIGGEIRYEAKQGASFSLLIPIDSTD